MRRLLLQSERKKYKRKGGEERRAGRTGNNSNARLRLFEGKGDKASIRQVVVHDVCPSSVPMSYDKPLIVLAQMMITMTAAARGATVAGEVEEITETGAQMMTDVQGLAMSRLDPVLSELKPLLILPHRHRGVPSPFRRPTHQLLDQMPPSPQQ